MIELEISCGDEHWTEFGETVELTVDQGLLDKIRIAQMWLKAHKDYWKVEAFDYRIEGWGISTECEILCVMDDDVQWVALIKHTQIELVTERVKLERLEKEIE